MKKSYIKSALLAMAAPFLMASCSSDSNNEPVIESDDFEGIELSIPKVVATRSALTGNEATVKTLTLIAYDKNDASKPKAYYTFEDVTGNTEITNYNLKKPTSYTKVPFKVPQGEYEVYVVANIFSKSDDNTVKDLSKSDLLGKELSSQSIKTDEDVANTSFAGFPMSCHHKDLKKGAADNADKYGTTYVKIDAGKATKVFADLTIGYAKVSLTLYNGVNTSLKVNSFAIGKFTTTLGAITPIIDQSFTESDSYSNYKFYKYPLDSNSKPVKLTQTALASRDIAADLADANVIANTAIANTNYWIFNGTWYVPERLISLYKKDEANEAKKTSVIVGFNDSGSYSINKAFGSETKSGTTDVYGPVRGTYYELVGVIEGKEVTIEARVKQWVRHISNMDLE